MTVKEVLTLAAGNLGREDLVAALEAEDAAALSEETQRELTALVRCYNLVENEVALDFFPLKAEENLPVREGKTEYNSFSHEPVHVQKVVCAGRLARFRVFPAYLSLPDVKSGTATVTYAYSPAAKQIADNTEFGEKISARLLSYGVTSEYYLASGEMRRAATWQKRFYDALRAVNLYRKTLYVRARRWA